MKAFVSCIILLVLILQKTFPQGWVELNTGVNVQLNSASSIYPVIQSYAVWVCGNNGTVIRSSNYGLVWQNVSGNGIPNSVNLVNIFAITSTSALTAGNSGSTTYLYRTTNSGMNWTQVFTQQNGFINAVQLSDSLHGLMTGNPVGGRWSLWKTSSGGINWDSTGLYLPQNGNESGLTNSLSVRTSEILFGTNNYRIYRSSDNGHIWQSINSQSQNIFYIRMVDLPGTAGNACGSSLFNTTNGGINWLIQTSLDSGNINAITGAEFYFLWYTRSNNKIYFWSHLYPFWNIAYSTSSGIYRYITSDRFATASLYIYALKDNGGITRFLLWAEGVQKISSEIPNNYSLSQNYPNPFNPVTKIKFDIPSNVKSQKSNMKIIVYDILGREIAVLVNEQLQPGTYEVEWDGTNYTSGMYFYKLITKGFSDTKKMVLIK